MTLSPFDSVRNTPLESDTDLVERLGMMLDGALRRQVWLMFLDDDAHQLPVVTPSYVPARPRASDVPRLAAFFRGLSEELEADSVVVTYERRGGADVTEADRAWLRCLRDASIASGLTFRGPFLCHNAGVAEVAPEAYVRRSVAS